MTPAQNHLPVFGLEGEIHFHLIQVTFWFLIKGLHGHSNILPKAQEMARYCFVYSARYGCRRNFYENVSKQTRLRCPQRFPWLQQRLGGQRSRGDPTPQRVQEGEMADRIPLNGRPVWQLETQENQQPVDHWPKSRQNEDWPAGANVHRAMTHKLGPFPTVS